MVYMVHVNCRLRVGNATATGCNHGGLLLGMSELSINLLNLWNMTLIIYSSMSRKLFDSMVWLGSYACLICTFECGLGLLNATIAARYSLSWVGIECWICYEFSCIDNYAPLKVSTMLDGQFSIGDLKFGLHHQAFLWNWEVEAVLEVAFLTCCKIRFLTSKWEWTG